MNANRLIMIVLITLMIVLILEMKAINNRLARIQEYTGDTLPMVTSMFTQGRVGMEVK